MMQTWIVIRVLVVLCGWMLQVEGFATAFSAGGTTWLRAEPRSCARKWALGRMSLAHLEQQWKQQGGLLEASKGCATEQSMRESRRSFIRSGILTVLLSGSFVRPAMGDEGESRGGSLGKKTGAGSEYGTQSYLRQTLRLIDVGDLGAAEQRLTKSIGAWKDTAVDLTVLLKVCAES